MSGLRTGTAALCALLSGLAGAEPTLVAGQAWRRAAPPTSLSGITWAGGSRYYAVADEETTGEVGLYSMDVELASNGLSIVSCRIDSVTNRTALAGTRDLEDVAFDAANGTVWAADETRCTVKEYSISDGSVLRTLELPEILCKHRPNLGLESLALSADGRTLWTCTEESLACDGPRSSSATGTTVRLLKFTRNTARDGFSHASTFRYTTDAWHQSGNYKGQARRGVSGLCALPDGTLLVLERELSFGSSNKFAAACTAFLSYTIYLFKPEQGRKKKLVSGGGSVFTFGNFEGICLGPDLANGGRSVLLVSDAGDGVSQPFVLPLVLSEQP